jgi:hypothetical protein
VQGPLALALALALTLLGTRELREPLALQERPVPQEQREVGCPEFQARAKVQCRRQWQALPPPGRRRWSFSFPPFLQSESR